MRQLTKERGESLNAAGLPVTPETLSLAHFAGAKGAIAILKAKPETAIEKILSDDAMEANAKLLNGKTAADLILWAAKRVGGGREPLPKPPVSLLDRRPVPGP
jgi:hypothetical protein